MSNNVKYFLTALCIVAVAAVGSIFTGIGQEWYAILIRPSQWPPNYLFPIVWSAIYLLVFFALCYCIKQNVPNLKKLLIVAAINGVLNVLWCLTFFTLHMPLLGLVAIILNLAAAIALVAEIYGANKIWAYFTAIYPLWVSLATALNLAIWILN